VFTLDLVRLATKQISGRRPAPQGSVSMRSTVHHRQSMPVTSGPAATRSPTARARRCGGGREAPITMTTAADKPGADRTGSAGGIAAPFIVSHECPIVTKHRSWWAPRAPAPGPRPAVLYCPACPYPPISVRLKASVADRWAYPSQKTNPDTTFCPQTPIKKLAANAVGGMRHDGATSTPGTEDRR
jgi:hypothetical protein